MEINKICVLGGSGFVGRHIVHLLTQSYMVRVPTRNRERAKPLIVLPTAEVVSADIHDPKQLNRLFSDMDAVINLVGILHGSKKQFEHVHIELVSKIIDACRNNGVKHLLHMSALQADPNGPSIYLQSKGKGEQLVKDAGSSAWNASTANAFLHTTIFRPSVIFGPNDRFLNLFAKLVRYLPVIFLASPNARFQPIYVEDVARAFAESVGNPDCFAQSYNLCGPRTYRLRELMDLVNRITGENRRIIGLNKSLSYLQAFAMELLPGKLMTRDNYKSMKVDSVCNSEFPAAWGFKPTPLEAVAPTYLAERTPRARYRWLRYKARR